MATALPASKASEKNMARSNKALVVDDETVNRLMLRSLLTNIGYEVVMAESGQQAIALFDREQPDIVFLDVLMPGMDGYETVQHLKALSNGNFVPVIFVTAMNDKAALAKCIEAGGDDFLTKPYVPALLQAKITAIRRVRDIYQTVQNQHAQLVRDQELAEKVFSKAVLAGNAQYEHLRVLLRPAATFSGDLLLTERTPEGGLNVLLGDFTGHGLGAAIGAIPVSQIFRSMTQKGFSASHTLTEINRKLSALMPVNMFLAATFIHLNGAGRLVEVWNGGLPDVLLLDKGTGKITARIPSSSLPLGICSDINDYRLTSVETNTGDQLVFYSDGVTEARDSAGELFGQARLEQALQAGEAGMAFERVQDFLKTFCANATQDDDVSLVMLPCHPLSSNAPRVAPVNRATAGDAVARPDWRWQITLRDAALKEVEAVPLALNQLNEIITLNEHRQSLFTVLMELYTNALDHGVLGLPSSLKSSPEGYGKYYAEREQRLAGIAKHHVKITLNHTRQGKGGRLCIRMMDSGPGFDHAAIMTSAEECLTRNNGYCGRGIALVRSLCESVVYKGKGNIVEAIYAW